jgi:tRNA-splicing endonuclease subunit Sen15, fungi type
MGDRATPRELATPIQPSPDPAISGLQEFIAANKLPKEFSHPQNYHLLALQIVHNLRYQHNWTELRLHYHASKDATAQSLPRPVISGLPPQRLYVHPDEQIEVLQKQRAAGKAGWPELSQEREWVCPSQLRESWTLRRFAEVFDALSSVPPEKEGGPLYFEAESWSRRGITTPLRQAGELRRERSTSSTRSGSRPPAAPTSNSSPAPSTPNPWRTSQPKRMLLATLDDDSTVVYYIVHDGIVKPRQN